MRRVCITVAACFCLFAVGLGFAGPGFSSGISYQLSGSWTSDEQLVVDNAVSQWNALLTIPQDLTIGFSKGDLSNLHAAGVELTTSAASGLPLTALITIANATQYPMSWNPNNPVESQVDVFSVVGHELGHALGFVYEAGLINIKYDSAVTYASGNAYIHGYQLYSTDLTGLSHMADPNDLMYGGGALYGVRTVPSLADLQVLSLTYGYTINAPQTIGPGVTLTNNPGETMWNYVGLQNGGRLENNGTYINNYILTNNGTLTNSKQPLLRPYQRTLGTASDTGDSKSIRDT